MTHTFLVDSKGLHKTITRLHLSREYKLRQTVEHIRASFETGEIYGLRWIEGKVNLADALTRNNTISHHLLQRILASGFLISPDQIIKELNANQRKGIVKSVSRD